MSLGQAPAVPSNTAAGTERQAPRLLEVLRATARQRGHAASVAETYARWVTRFVRFHDCRHPREYGCGLRVTECCRLPVKADLRIDHFSLAIAT